MLDLSCLIYPIFTWYCHYSDRKHWGKPLLENCRQWRVSRPSLKGMLLHTTTGHSSSSACTQHRQPLWVDLTLLSLYTISIVTDNSLLHPVNCTPSALWQIIHCYIQWTVHCQHCDRYNNSLLNPVNLCHQHCDRYNNSLLHPANHAGDVGYTIGVVTDIIIHCYSRSTIGWVCFTEAGCVLSSDWLGLFYRGWVCVIQWLVGLVLQRLGVCHPVIGWACFTRAGLETVAQWFIWSFSNGQKVHHAMICWDCSSPQEQEVCLTMIWWEFSTGTGVCLTMIWWDCSTKTGSVPYNKMLGLFYRDRECVLQYVGIVL